MKSLLVFIACAALFVVAAPPAGAASGSGFAPQLSCYPGIGPCQETDHFSLGAFVGSPLPGCGTLAEDALISTTGNGVQHINVNASQDFWFTTTMVGATTIVQGTVAADGTFIPDYSLPTFSGQLQQWFGESVNRQNVSVSSTGNFQGTSSTGASASLHFNTHLNTMGAKPPIPNMNSMHFDVSCS
jgi:hypothetical protein